MLVCASTSAAADAVPDAGCEYARDTGLIVCDPAWLATYRDFCVSETERADVAEIELERQGRKWAAALELEHELGEAALGEAMGNCEARINAMRLTFEADLKLKNDTIDRLDARIAAYESIEWWEKHRAILAWGTGVVGTSAMALGVASDGSISSRAVLVGGGLALSLLGLYIAW